MENKENIVSKQRDKETDEDEFGNFVSGDDVNMDKF